MELLLLPPNFKYMDLFWVLYALKQRLRKISNPERRWSHSWKACFLRGTQQNSMLISSQISLPQRFSLL